MSYCKAAWNGVHIQPTGRTGPCCAWPNTVEFNRDSVQADMLAGRTVAGCALCDRYEENNRPSLRQYYNQHMTGEPHITHVDISVDNVCNLQCLMCSSEYSHQNAHRERVFLGRSITGTTVCSNTAYTDMDWSSVTHIKLFGGEPTYSPGVVRFLEWAADRINFEHIHLEIITNNTVEPTGMLDRVLRCAASLRVIASVDGTDPVNSMIRQGTQHQCYDYWESIPGAQLNINTAVSIYNAPNIAQFLQWVQQHRPKWNTHLEMVQSPAYLNLQHMPQDLKQQYRDLGLDPRVQQWMDTPAEDLFDEFLLVHRALNTMYQLALESTNPTLYQYSANRRCSSSFEGLKQRYL